MNEVKTNLTVIKITNQKIVNFNSWQKKSEVSA